MLPACVPVTENIYVHYIWFTVALTMNEQFFSLDTE